MIQQNVRSKPQDTEIESEEGLTVQEADAEPREKTSKVSSSGGFREGLLSFKGKVWPAQSAQGGEENESDSVDLPVASGQERRTKMRMEEGMSRLAILEAIAAGDSFRESKNWAAARDAYTRALLIDNTLQPIWIQLGHAAKESGDLRDAEAAYRKAVHLTPEDPDAHLQLGHVLKLRGLFTPALASYSRALLINPESVDARAEMVLLERMAESKFLSVEQSEGFSASPDDSLEAEKDPNALTIVFDVSDLLHYFHNARLPTGIQRVQIEVIRGAMKAWREGVRFALVCFTKQTDFWIKIPTTLFEAFCKASLTGGDIAAPEWVSLLADLERVLESRNYYRFPQGAMLLNLGTSWWLQNYFLNVRVAKSTSGVKYVPFVHDFIPAMTPEHCVDELRQDFISWAVGAFEHADHFLVNSNATLTDLRAIGSRLGHAVPDAAVVRLDADFRGSLRTQSDAADAAQYLYSHGLQKGGYVLFVATVESRKNHVTAFSVWLKLLKKYGARSVPKLVCVGNDGWLNDAAYAKLRASELLSNHVLMLQKVPDAGLAALYENCLCTLYPSSYEGWGLPVTEALCFGKLPIISNSSSLPEAGGEFAEYFDLESEKDFQAAVERVVFDEEYRRNRERKILSDFHPRSWGEISDQIMQQLKDWRTPADTDAEAAPVPTLNGILAFRAELNELHMLSNCSSSMLWRGLRSGEIYRNGAGWWWPEPWGTWIKNTGPAYVAFKAEDETLKDHAPLVIYIGLRGVQGKQSQCTLKIEGVAPVHIFLREDEERVVKVRLPSYEAGSSVVISITCDVAADFARNSNGADTRVAGVGVRWFYACSENDLIGRMNLLEALSVGSVEQLRRQAPLVRDFLLAPQ